MLLAQSPGQAGSDFEDLPGFRAVVAKHVGATIGLDRLPRAVGLPVEPGVYVTLGRDQMMIFDSPVASMRDGALAEDAIAAACESACPAAAFEAFRTVWFDLARESKAVVVDFPSRVLFAADAGVLAHTLVVTAYAASETRTRGNPSLQLLVHRFVAGVRARPFFLLPPRGLTLEADTGVLGLRITVQPGGVYTVDAASPRFQRTIRLQGLELLRATVADIKKHYPNKEIVQIEVGTAATLADVVGVVVAVEGSFRHVILSAGQRITLR